MHSTEDVNRDCVHYPTREHRTYADCDQDFVRKTLPEDLVPFWNVDNISSASSFWNDKDSKIYRKAVANLGLFCIIKSYCTKYLSRNLSVWWEIDSLQGKISSADINLISF